MRTSELLPTVVVTAAAAVFAVGPIRLQQKHQALAPMRESAAREPAILRASTVVKLLLPPDIWSTKTLGSMGLVVDRERVAILTRPAGFRAVLGSEWYFVARDTRVRRTAGPPDPLRREWIVVHRTSAGKEVDVGVSTPMAAIVVWNALLRAGCKADD